jgi:16S rRNA (uracil1498-N3)-methyltransferase
MSERFFTEVPVSGEQAELRGPEAHHLARVMRAQVGESILLFDGSGDEFTACIERLQKDRVELRIVERRSLDRESPHELTLAVALPKGDRQKWLLEKIVELGAARLVPLVTQRGVAQPVEQALARLERAAIEASKQCGRNRLLQVAPPIAAGDYFPLPASSTLRLLADPSGTALANEPQPLPRAIQAAVGPEGGFTSEELATARDCGWQVVSLGPRILRIETAAIALAAWVSLAPAPSAADELEKLP